MSGKINILLPCVMCVTKPILENVVRDCAVRTSIIAFTFPPQNCTSVTTEHAKIFPKHFVT